MAPDRARAKCYFCQEVIIGWRFVVRVRVSTKLSDEPKAHAHCIGPGVPGRVASLRKLTAWLIEPGLCGEAFDMLTAVEKRVRNDAPASSSGGGAA